MQIARGYSHKITIRHLACSFLVAFTRAETRRPDSRKLEIDANTRHATLPISPGSTTSPHPSDPLGNGGFLRDDKRLGLPGVEHVSASAKLHRRGAPLLTAWVLCLPVKFVHHIRGSNSSVTFIGQIRRSHSSVTLVAQICRSNTSIKPVDQSAGRSVGRSARNNQSAEHAWLQRILLPPREHSTITQIMATNRVRCFDTQHHPQHQRPRPWIEPTQFVDLTISSTGSPTDTTLTGSGYTSPKTALKP